MQNLDESLFTRIYKVRQKLFKLVFDKKSCNAFSCKSLLKLVNVVTDDFVSDS